MQRSFNYISAETRGLAWWVGWKEIHVSYIEAVNRGTKYTQKVPTTYIYIYMDGMGDGWIWWASPWKKNTPSWGNAKLPSRMPMITSWRLLRSKRTKFSMQSCHHSKPVSGFPLFLCAVHSKMDPLIWVNLATYVFFGAKTRRQLSLLDLVWKIYFQWYSSRVSTTQLQRCVVFPPFLALGTFNRTMQITWYE